MESITLKMLELELENYKKIDLEKKIDIAVNIFDRMQDSPTEDSRDVECCSMDKISSLTGVNTTILAQIRKLEDVSRKFEEWAKEEEVTTSMNILYTKMKQNLQYYYTHARKIPTKSELFVSINKKVRAESQAIFNKYFTTIQVPDTQHSLIVEKPEIVLNRHRYLRKKIELVEAEKVFVYIEDTCFQGRQRTSFKMTKLQYHKSKRLVLAVSPELGFVSSIYCSRTTESHLRHWLEETVLPILPPGCVIVVEDSLFADAPYTPKSHSSKQEMVDWLVQKDIAHDPQLHRAELYALIKIYKKTCSKISKINHILQAYGHTALCREDGVVFEYFNPFWKKLREILGTRKGAKILPRTPTLRNQLPFAARRIASLIQKEYWQELQKTLLDLEVDAYRKDQEMEELIDKLMIYAASEQFDPEDTEFDDYCEAMGQEYIFSNN